MRAFTIKFETTQMETNLFERYAVVAKLKEFGYTNYQEDGLLARITVIVERPTQIKFSDLGAYEDFIEDVVYDSGGVYLFGKVIIKDSMINGSITISLE